MLTQLSRGWIVAKVFQRNLAKAREIVLVNANTLSSPSLVGRSDGLNDALPSRFALFGRQSLWVKVFQV